jgi:hypothetical protein
MCGRVTLAEYYLSSILHIDGVFASTFFSPLNFSDSTGVRQAVAILKFVNEKN